MVILSTWCETHQIKGCVIECLESARRNRVQYGPQLDSGYSVAVQGSEECALSALSHPEVQENAGTEK